MDFLVDAAAREQMTGCATAQSNHAPQYTIAGKAQLLINNSFRT
jgi:hypothetical protein